MVWIVGLAGSVTGAMSFTALRASAQRFQAGLVVWMLSLFLIIGALLVKRGQLDVPGWNQFPVIAAVCVFGVLSQFLQTRSYSYLPAAIAAALGLSSVIWSFIFDVSLFGRAFGAVQIASTMLFIGATGVLVYLRNSREEIL